MLVCGCVLRVSRRATVLGCLVVAGLSLCGCSTTTTRLSTVNGRQTYAIECGDAGDCFKQASRTCRGSYQTLERHDRWISEADLPGLNDRTEAHLYQRWTLTSPSILRPAPYGPNIESDRPLPITNVVVMCTDG